MQDTTIYTSGRPLMLPYRILLKMCNKRYQWQRDRVFTTVYRFAVLGQLMKIGALADGSMSVTVSSQNNVYIPVSFYPKLNTLYFE